MRGLGGDISAWIACRPERALTNYNCCLTNLGSSAWLPTRHLYIIILIMHSSWYSYCSGVHFATDSSVAILTHISAEMAFVSAFFIGHIHKLHSMFGTRSSLRVMLISDEIDTRLMKWCSGTNGAILIFWDCVHSELIFIYQWTWGHLRKIMKLRVSNISSFGINLDFMLLQM